MSVSRRLWIAVAIGSLFFGLVQACSSDDDRPRNGDIEFTAPDANARRDATQDVTIASDGSGGGDSEPDVTSDSPSDGPAADAGDAGDAAGDAKTDGDAASDAKVDGDAAQDAPADVATDAPTDGPSDAPTDG